MKLEDLISVITSTKKGALYALSSLHSIREAELEMERLNAFFRKDIAQFTLNVLLTKEERAQLKEWATKIITMSSGSIPKMPEVVRPIEVNNDQNAFEPSLRGLLQNAEAINFLLKEYRQEILRLCLNGELVPRIEVR